MHHALVSNARSGTHCGSIDAKAQAIVMLIIVTFLMTQAIVGVVDVIEVTGVMLMNVIQHKVS